MGHAGGLDHPSALELDAAEPLEEANAPSEQQWHDVNLHFVDEPRAERLLDRVRAAGDQDVLVAGDRVRLAHGAVDAVGHERERRLSLCFRLACLVREDEHGHVEGRLVAPPTGVLVHPLAEHDRAVVQDRLFDDLRVTVSLAALEPVTLTPARETEDPLVDPLAAFSERQVRPIVSPGDVAVQRHRDVDVDFAHSVGLDRRWHCASVRRSGHARPQQAAADAGRERSERSADEERVSHRRNKVAAAGPIEMKPLPMPDSAAEALDRVTIPPDAMARIIEALSTGGSIIVSDQGINQGETGEGTDFIVSLH